MDYTKILSQEVGNEIRLTILKEIEDNGYITMNKFVNIFRHGISTLPGDKNIKEIFLILMECYPSHVAKLFMINTPHLEYIEKDKIIKLKIRKIQ